MRSQHARALVACRLQEEVRLISLPMNEIERALTAHPDVADAVMSVEESHDGRQFRVAFAAVAPDRLSAGKSKPVSYTHLTLPTIYSV